MKKYISAMLALLLVAFALAACSKTPTPQPDTTYGDVAYIEYTEDESFTFEYLDCFEQSSEEGDTFVAKTPDGKSVLMFEVDDLGGRTYSQVAAYNADEAKSMLKLAAGLVSSLNAEITEKDFAFTVEEYIHMYLWVSAAYESGDVQDIFVEKVILPDSTVYTLHSFLPHSAYEAHGKPFKNAEFIGTVPESNVPAGYHEFNNGTVSFAYCDLFQGESKPEGFMMYGMTGASILFYQVEELAEGYAFETIDTLAEDELVDYMDDLSGSPAANVEHLNVERGEGVVRLDIIYRTQGAQFNLYVVTTQFVLSNGATHTVVAYMAESQLENYPDGPVTAIEYIAE